MRRKFILENGLHLSFAVALLATLGSLYLSEILRYEPCKLCWIQRIFMYPLVFLLGIAAAKKDYAVTRYVLPLAMTGSVVSIYHYLIQKAPFFRNTEGAACGQTPCAFDYLDWWGVVTIPLLCLIAFIVIIALQIMIRREVNR